MSRLSFLILILLVLGGIGLRAVIDDIPATIRQNHQFALGAEHTAAVIIHLSEDKRHYYVDCFYWVGNRQYFGHLPVGLDTWKHVRHDVHIPVKYLPDQPSVCRVDRPDEDRWFRSMPWVFAGLMGLIGVAGFVRFHFITKDRARRKAERQEARAA